VHLQHKLAEESVYRECARKLVLVVNERSLDYASLTEFTHKIEWVFLMSASNVVQEVDFRPRSDTRDRLLAAAVELFGSRGFDSVSMKDLAAEVGIKAPAMYNHFKSKEELLAEAVSYALGAFNEDFAKADDVGIPPLDRLHRLVSQHILYQINNSRIAKANDRLLASDVLNRLHPSIRRKVRDLLRANLDRLTDIVEATKSPVAKTRTDARLTALAIMTMCDNVLDWHRPNGAYSPEKISRHFCSLVTNMLQEPSL